MLNKFKKFFVSELHLTEDKSENEAEKLQQACAVLLIEVSRADYQQTNKELNRVSGLLDKLFHLPSDKLTTLIDISQSKADELTSYYPFVKLINENYDNSQRISLLKMMWQVAFVDDEISEYEDHLIRKIADLLYISHSDFIQTKLQVTT